MTLDVLRIVLHREMEDPATGQGGAHIVDLADDSTVFQYDSLTPRLMASTTKTFTAGLALQALGRDARFHTRLLADRLPDSKGDLPGDLFVVGGGDPTLGNADHIESTYQGEGTSVERIIEAVTAAGVRRVQGRVVGDGSLFDTASETTRHVTALTYNRNREDQPVLHAAQKITQHMVKANIPVEGLAAEGTAQPRMFELGAVASPRVMSLLTKAGHDSDNFVAETFTKHLAAHHHRDVNSTEAGASALQHFAAGKGASVALANGSGLGHANRCSPNDITQFLISMNKSTNGRNFMRTMPRAGMEGTLKHRMRNTWAAESVRAKTGTLTRRRKPLQDSLAGYVMGPERTLAFSLVFEGAESRYAARASLDRITELIAVYCRQPKSSFIRRVVKESRGRKIRNSLSKGVPVE